MFSYCCYFIVLLLLMLSGNIHPNPGPRGKGCRVMYTNIRGLKKNLKDLSAYHHDILCSSETLVFEYRRYLFLDLTSHSYQEGVVSLEHKVCVSTFASGLVALAT